MSKTIETKIHLNVLLIYIIAVILCCAMILFFYYSRNNINEQKKNIEEHDQIMLNIKTLITNIDQAQQEINDYIGSKNISRLDSFNNQLVSIERQIDSLKINLPDSVPIKLLDDLEVLLKRKGNTVSQLSGLFVEQAFFKDKIRENLLTYKSLIKKDGVDVKTRMVKDTLIIGETKKKNLWEKITSIFSSKQSNDTIMASTNEIIDTVKISPRDSSFTTSKRKTIVEDAQIDYNQHLQSLEEQVVLLILSDQEISTNIFNLLFDFNNKLVESRLDEIKENEQWLRKNNSISIGIGLLALFLILLFIILIINDVNKGLRMRKSLEIANKRTQQLMESRHQLLLSVSHDIKTPLSSILGYLELNSRQNQLTIQDLSSMRNSGSYILALLENLLEFSSLQQGSLTATRTTFNLSKLCNEIKEMFDPLAHQKGLSFKYQYDATDDLHITTDLLKLKQIIINILSNAIKYTPSGVIDFSIRFDNDQLYIQITDTGIGIPHEQVDLIFQPFTRIDENRNIAEGTGFGMYVVKGLVDLLDGTIKIDSVVNIGTTISVKIPAAAARIEKEKKSGLKIYVIDDDPGFSNLLSKMLGKLGHQVISSKCYDDFVHSEQQLSTFDLIFTDMEMGGISGTDILKVIRTLNSSLPVYVITGRSDFSQKQAYALGFNGYLPKPVTIDELSNILNQLSAHDRTDQQQSLRDIFGNDESAIREVMNVFLCTAEENLINLEEFISTGAYGDAQAICHKMLPMFLQTGQYELADYLSKMDRSRNQPELNYPSWRDEGNQFIIKAKEMLNRLSDFYN